jgi:hypothetical protein
LALTGIRAATQDFVRKSKLKFRSYSQLFVCQAGCNSRVHCTFYIFPILNFKSERLIKSSAVSPLKIKIPSKNLREKPTNTPIIHSVY